jgi:hypothetical protein
MVVKVFSSGSWILFADIIEIIFYSVIQLPSCLANILFITFDASDDLNYMGPVVRQLNSPFNKNFSFVIYQVFVGNFLCALKKSKGTSVL